MRDALALVKQEQGSDAVILGNKKVPGGVELISAIDYDEEAVHSMEYQNSQSPRIAKHGQARSSKSDLAGAIDVASDVWVGSLINDTLNDRKEPTLGRVARSGKKPVIPSARPPAWLEKEFVYSEKALREARHPRSPVAKTVKTAAKRKVASGVARAKFTVKKTGAKKVQQARAIKPEKAFRPDREPIIDEVKHELRNLRDLMESQLSVLQWDKFSRSHPVRTVLLNRMSEMGLGADICEIVFSHLHQLNNDPQKLWQQALGILAKCLPENRRDLLAEGGRIALVGSTGVGKTTTIAKLAARFAHNHGKRSVAMISTDQFRIGAQEQLQHFARLLEIPLLSASNSEELADRLDMLADKKLVLIDTAGMSQRDLKLSEQFHRLQHASPFIKPYLVLSANTQLAAINQTILNFKKVKLAGAFVTKMDEAASLGGIITASIRHRLALTYFGTGQRVPEDLEAARNHRLISKAVTLMQCYSEPSDQEALALKYNHIISKNQT